MKDQGKPLRLVEITPLYLRVWENRKLLAEYQNDGSLTTEDITSFMEYDFANNPMDRQLDEVS